MSSTKQHVNYEDFGAIGDGVADDLPAICKAHAYANENNFSVKAKSDASYHLGSKELTVIIATDTDWNTARFMIDDTKADDNKHSLFHACSLLDPLALEINKMSRDQKTLDISLKQSCFVMVENDDINLYIRRGLNQNEGKPQHDCFILHPDGTIEGDIDWHYDHISRVKANPIEEHQLVIQGGIFTTIANRMEQKEGYNYWARNIQVTRSNTLVEGLTHYVIGETSVGHPYNGFISAIHCANITIKDCFVTGHKIYQTIGTAGEPVSMGSYDLHANDIVNFHLINCHMNHILDRTRWGVIGSNFCKNILLEGCTLSRMDTHMGVSGNYIVRNCTLGHMGLNAIGRGLLQIEDSTLHGGHLVNFRGDYGSTWEGEILIKNCRWIPACGKETWPYMFCTVNDSTHDYGYPCFMPQVINIDGLHVEDSQTPDDYTGMYIFQDPDGQDNKLTPADRSFPYARCQSITINNLTTVSNKKLQVSPNEELNARLTINET
ncbi:MAG: hypothetical protein COA79_09105 [Planctomycetota bacterium]|nr:MAG: hypothetical protein COA79_09105 [Planctomycetota bacterium]